MEGKINHRFINYNQFKLIKDEITGKITALFDNYIDQINLDPDNNDELDYKNYSINQKLQTLDSEIARSVWQYQSCLI